MMLNNMVKLRSVFGKDNNILIGAVHFPPLVEFAEFPGFKVAKKNAIFDLKVFEKAKFDGIIFENNYDIPHSEFVTLPTVAAMTSLGQSLIENSKIPTGVSVLWNDYRAALGISKTLNLRFIRIPVFVDKVRTDYGIIEGNPLEVIKLRKKLRAENVAIFADIHVKHAKLLSSYSLVDSARLAIKKGADALILTGNWTGEAPALKDLAEVRKAVGKFPIFVGSGTSKENVSSILKYANGVIVSTSLKRGLSKKGEVNVKGYGQRIDPIKAKSLFLASR